MKKIISIMMVLAMVLTLLTVGITTTSAADTATITIYGLDGTTEVKEFEVGDEFTVYSTLNVSASVPNGMIGSIQHVKPIRLPKMWEFRTVMRRFYTHSHQKPGGFIREFVKKRI